MNQTDKKPALIHFSKIGDSSTGYISIAEKEKLPFVPKRIYWTYFTPEDVVRGFHSHHNLEQVLVAMAGKITLNIETNDGESYEFILDSPEKGVFIPKQCWRTMKYSHNAVQMCIASMEYDESDYIRDYPLFKK
ncbi:MAG: WxcM-like domain-containing protein [Flavobacterium sp.]|nr:MAG: WxcM-like domain-containing protein [Flavobacterium sp.]